MTSKTKTTRILVMLLLTMTITTPLVMGIATNLSRGQGTTTPLNQQPEATRDGIPPVTQKWAYGTDGYPVESSPAIADVDGDGKLDVLVGYSNTLAALNGTGQFERYYNIGGPDPSFSESPVIADVNGDGKLEVLIESGGNLVCDNGTTGETLFTIGLGSLFGTPAIGDVDGDGKPEIIAGTGAYYGYVYSFDGSTGVQEWQYPAEGTGVYAAPTLADINVDGRLEVLVAVGNNQGDIHCLNTTAVGGYVNSLWDYSTTSSPRSNYWYSSPAVGDIDHDGHMEVVVGSLDNRVYCLSYTGVSKWNFTTGGHIYSSPTIFDMDGDGKQEILVGSNDSKIYCLDSSGKLRWSYLTAGYVESSPAIADIDGDKQLEVLVGSDDGNLNCFDVNGGFKWSYPTADMTKSSPVVADIDGDNKLEVVFGSNDYTIYCLSVTIAPIVPSAYPWPSIGYREDIRHTGLITDLDHDGLTDNCEIIVGTDPQRADTDNDGLTDFQEFLRSSNPFAKDWLSNPPIPLIPGPGNNASMPEWYYGKYGFSVVTTNATGVVVTSGSSLPPDVGAPPNGTATFLYLDITGTQMSGTAGAAIYVFYNRTLVQSLGINELSMRLHRWNLTTSQWVAIPSTVTFLSTTHGVITAHLGHFSYFAVFGASSVSGSPTTLLLVAGAAGGAILVVLAIVTVRKRQGVAVARKRKAKVVRKRKK